MTDDRPRRRHDLSARSVGEEIIILDRVVNQVHHFNVTAAFVWRRCDGTHTALQIVEELVGAFDVDGATAADAVATSVRRFGELGLLSAQADRQCTS